MVNKSISTEERILEAAKTVFHRKGFEGARMQEIANEAGINKALLHYYYRTKENLFDAVFRDAFEGLFTRLFSIIGSELPLEEKIRQVFFNYITLLRQHSYIPWFILNSLHRNPEKIAEIFRNSRISPEDIFRKLKKSLAQEHLDGVDYRQFIINIISLSVFPVLGEPLIRLIFNLNEKEYERFIDDRKTELPEFFMNAIRAK
ncbi:MAG TPA: TetR/AcrR family transcriptional regulator [Bacteroidales bacterium]|nr:TetR/AcrR family transcriptional regulator [Bacteroidales bacterium]